MNNTTVYLVDAYAHIYRGYHAIADLKTKDGKPSNAVFAIAKFLISLKQNYNPRYGAFVFDKGAPAERLKICPEYKANRPGMPDDMRAQIETIRNLVVAMGWNLIEKEGNEADDLIASIAVKFPEADFKILTNDKDISQIIDDRVTLLAVNSFTRAIEERDTAKVIDKFGVKPSQIVDYLSMIGDSSDNIKGLPGIGPKTASKLLSEFESIDGIYLALEKLKTEKLRTLFSENRELMERNRELITLNKQIEFDDLRALEALKMREIDAVKAKKIADDYELKSLNGILNEIFSSEVVQENLFNF